MMSNLEDAPGLSRTVWPVASHDRRTGFTSQIAEQLERSQPTAGRSVPDRRRSQSFDDVFALTSCGKAVVVKIADRQ